MEALLLKEPTSVTFSLKQTAACQRSASHHRGSLFNKHENIFFKPSAQLTLEAHLSLGRAVHARLCDVPAEICWIVTPSRPTTFLGLVIGPVEFPWPHWPIELLPHAYASLSTLGIEKKYSM